MLLNVETIRSMAKEIGFDDWKRIYPKVTMFRHLTLREQDRFIEQMSAFPKLKLYLLELQRWDEQPFPKGVKQ